MASKVMYAMCENIHCPNHMVIGRLSVYTLDTSGMYWNLPNLRCECGCEPGLYDLQQIQHIKGEK